MIVKLPGRCRCVGAVSGVAESLLAGQADIIPNADCSIAAEGERCLHIKHANPFGIFSAIEGHVAEERFFSFSDSQASRLHIGLCE